MQDDILLEDYYIDINASGTTLNRREFQRTLQDITGRKTVLMNTIHWAVNSGELLFERASVYPQSQEAVRKKLTKILDLLMERTQIMLFELTKDISLIHIQ